MVSWNKFVGSRSISLANLYTVTFVPPILFRPDISTAVLDSRKFEVLKSQEFLDNYEYVTMKRYNSVKIKLSVKILKST